MSQRSSGYERKPDEAYETIAWPIVALLLHLSPIQRAWDCCDRGSGQLVATLRARGIEAIGTKQDFLSVTEPPADVSDLITNPPYGENRRGELAERLEQQWVAEYSKLKTQLRDQFPDLNPNSRIQIAKQLEVHGWIPDEYTKTGKARITNELLETIADLYLEFA